MDMMGIYLYHTHMIRICTGWSSADSQFKKKKKKDQKEKM